MGRRLVDRESENTRRGNEANFLVKMQEWASDNEKLIKCIALSIFLMAIAILPSFEAIELRYRKSVDISETPTVYQLKTGDVIEQKLILDEGDRLDDLRIWLSAYIKMENKGRLQITLTQGDVMSESVIDTSQIVDMGYVPTRLNLSKFTDGELNLKVMAVGLDDDSSISIRYTSGGAIYGLPGATINGTPCGGTLSLNFKICQPRDLEFLVSIGMVLLIIIVSILASYVMTYKDETARTGWLLVGLYVVLAMAIYTLQYPGKTWEGEPYVEDAIFFYDNFANMSIPKALRQLEGGMYLSSVQNILMIIALRILHLKTYAQVAVQSMGVFFWIICLAPFCSHYFKKYFGRAFRFVFLLVVQCYGFVFVVYSQAGYYGAFFLLLLLAYDFETCPNILYAAILAIIPVICTSKMMYVVFVPAMLVYFLLFRREMSRKKKGCVAMIGLCSFMEGFLSILLRHGVQAGHTFGTIQQVALPTLINKILYYTVQTFGIRLRCGTSNSNQLFQNVCVSVIVIGIVAFVIWQIHRKGRYRREAGFMLVMFSIILVQCAVIVLTITEWHADVSWKQSVTAFSGLENHPTNLYAAADIIFLVLLWVILQFFKPHLERIQDYMKPMERVACKALALFLVVGTTFFYINQHPGPKSYDAANPLRSSTADWKAYASMLDKGTFCIRIKPYYLFYSKDTSEKSVAISRSSSADLSTVAELDGKSAIVFYVHKTAVTNQILDRYYYMSLYDKDGNLISRLRQLNPDPERLYIAFYPDAGVANVGRVEFSYEDGSLAFVDETIEIGYR